MAEIKTLHSFVLKDKNNKEVKFLLKEPSRKDWHDVTKFYRIRFNQLQKEGFLTKAMIIANSETHGNGLLSPENIKKLEALRVEIQTLQAEAIESQIKNKDNFEVLEKELIEINKKIAKANGELVALESYYQSSFDNSVEVLAESDTIQYLMYFFTLVEADGKTAEYFPGKDFAERQNKDFDLSDAEDDVFLRVKDKLLTFFTLYFKGILRDKDDFVTLEARLSGNKEKESETKEEKPETKVENVESGTTVQAT